MAALEHLRISSGPHAAAKSRVTQAVAEDLEMAIVRDGLLSTASRGSDMEQPALRSQVNALKAMGVNVSCTPSRVWTRLVTNRPISVWSSR